VAYFEQALTAVRHLPERRETLEQAIDLRLDIRSALIALGELGAIFDHLRQAETLAQALGDQRRLGWVCVYMSNAFNFSGSVDGQGRAIEAGQRALAMATASEDFVLEMVATRMLGAYYFGLGNYRQAIHYHRKNVEALVGEWLHERLGEAGLPSVISRAFLARSLAELGAFAEGSAHGAEAVRIAEAVEQPYDLSQAYFGVGSPLLRKGDLPQAILVLEKGLAICQTGDVSRQLGAYLSFLGYAYALSGRLAEAFPLLEQAVDWGASRLQMTGNGEAHLLAGHLEDAYQLAERALARTRDLKQRGHEAYALRLLGDIAAHCDPPEAEAAETSYHQALTLAEELGMRPLQAHCHLGLGTLYARTGQREQAHAELATAIALYRAMEMTFWLPQAEVVLAQVA
jgi:tetratricopeptide (TPR) repeat protein